MLRFRQSILRVLFLVLIVSVAQIFATESDDVQCGAEQNCDNPMYKSVSEHENAQNSEAVLEGSSPAKRRFVRIVQWQQKDDFLARKDTYECLAEGLECEISTKRKLLKDPDTLGVIWHSCDIDLLDMPKYRAPHHQWVLFNDESPCGHVVQLSPECLELFNLTAGLRADHVWPQTLLQILWSSTPEKLQENKPIPIEEKNNFRQNGTGPILYLQSHCGVPSLRDEYVEELMKYVRVDASGKCLHNHDMPEDVAPWGTLLLPKLTRYIARYKFTLAFENCLCQDYVTEKFFRPLDAGSVPVVLGTRNALDWGPSDHSVINARDYASPKELAEYLDYLDKNDTAYNEYLTWKFEDISQGPLSRRFYGPYRHTRNHYKKNTAGVCRICAALANPDNPYTRPDGLIQERDIGCEGDFESTEDTKGRMKMYAERCTAVKERYLKKWNAKK